MESKYHNGDTVKVIDYGELVFDRGTCHHCQEVNWRDTMPSIVGKTGIVIQVTDASGIPLYTLDGIPEKKQFYNEDQLQLV